METLTALANAFLEFTPRLYVVDSAARQRAGFWDLDDPVPTHEVVSILDQTDLLRADDTLYIPTHHLDNAELTGQYLLCRAANASPRIEFYDFARQKTVALSIEEFSRTTVALAVRFWHPEYDAPATPSYLQQPRPHASTASAPRDADAEVEDGIFSYARLFVERDRDAAREDHRARYRSLSRTAFFDQHEGIDHMLPAGRYADRDGGQICKLTSPTKATGTPAEAGITPGVEVLVDAIEPTDGFPVDAEVTDIVDDSELHLRVKWSTSSDHGAAEAAFAADSETEFVIAKLVDPAVFTQQRGAIDDVEAHAQKQPIITGEQAPSFNSDADVDVAIPHLDEYQAVALQQALAANDCLCIRGGPGTGKTRVAMLLAREAARRGDKVLVCAGSSPGVDRLLLGESTRNRVDPKSPHADAVTEEYTVARVGPSPRDLIRDHYLDVETWEANVVGAPLDATGRFREDEFDLVIVDDAHACTVPWTLLAYSKGERLVLVGDEMRLPPRPTHETDESESSDLSLFDHLVSIYPDDGVAVLPKQYQMHQDIAAFPNAQFYDGALVHGQRNREWTIRQEAPLVAVDCQGEEATTPTGSYYNVAEAEAVVREISTLLHRGVSPTQIAVLTPYSGQVGMITKLLDDRDLSDRLTVATLEGFPSTPFDVVVVSFVRSNTTGETGYLAFPTEGPRRLNTMLTRARKRLVLIGNWDTLRSTSDGTDASAAYEALYTHLEQRQCLTSNHPA